MLDSFDPFKEVNFTDNKDLVAQTIDNFDTLGESAVYEAILKGVMITADEKTERRAVLVMSDGHDNKSRENIATAETPEKLARDKRIPIFTVGISSPDFESNLDYLSALAGKTGGEYQEAENISDVGFLFEKVGEQLRQQYHIIFRGEKLPDGGQHSITLRVDTMDGVASIDKVITYPEPPIIPKIVQLQQDKNGRLDKLRPELVGPKVILVPEIVALNQIAKVEYRVNDELLETVDALGNSSAKHQPWEWTWDISDLKEGAYKLSITAFDNTNTASEPFIIDLQLKPGALVQEDVTAAPSEPTATSAPTATPTPAGPLPPGIAKSLPPFLNDSLTLGVISVFSIIIILVIIGALILSMKRKSEAPPPQPEVQSIPYAGESEEPITWKPTTPAPQNMSEGGIQTAADDPMSPTPIPQNFAGPVTTIGDLGVPQLSRQDKTELIQVTGRLPISGLLVVQEGTSQLAAGQTFPLAEKMNKVGRAEDNLVVLEDGSVSRHHAKIVLEGMVFRLYDLGSANGVKVNGKKIDNQILRENDRLEFGRVKLIFILLDKEKSQAGM
jgi:hypothetical protein